MAHHTIFREELAIAYPRYGLALWEPGPGGLYDAVEVGDVGFTRDGYFQRLFNVLHPRDHPSHRNPSLVPEGHEQLQAIPFHIRKGEIRAGSGPNSNYLCSTHVTLKSRGLGAFATRPDDDSQVTFSCNAKQGALLSLPVSAQSEDTVALGKFGNWMVTHIDAWFDFIRSLGLGINRMEDIILVTGRHLTKSWINVAFNQGRRDAEVSFNAQVSDDSDIQLERQYVHGGELKLGPTGKDLPENQCIFLRGFRVTRFLGIWPRLRGQAGPAPDTSGHGPEAGPDPQLRLVDFAAADHQDPLDVLLRYIAEQAPQCDMALIHDDDLTTIGGGLTTQPDELMALLRSSLPTMQEFECSLLYDDVETIKVATLSKHILQNPGGGSSPPRRTFSNRSYDFADTVAHPVPAQNADPVEFSDFIDFSDSINILDSIDIPVPVPVDISAPLVVDSPSSDPINNFLQEARGHNLVPFLQFTDVQSGPATTAADQRDYAVDLNNFLQGHPTGNLTKYFRYKMTREGRDDAPTHIATAIFRGVEYAVGRGQNKFAAKRDAAKQVYENFSVNGVPGTGTD